MSDGPAENEGHLQGTLQQRHLTMIALGGVIGAGLFVGSGAVIAVTGPAAVVSYVLSGILIVLAMRMLGEMAAAHPTAGSFTELIRRSLGDGAGFTSGWLYWYFWVIVVGFEAVAGAGVLQRWLDVPLWIMAGQGDELRQPDRPRRLRTRGCGGHLQRHRRGDLLHGRGGDRHDRGRRVGGSGAGHHQGHQRGRLAHPVFFVGSIFLLVTILPWNDARLGDSPYVAALDVMGIPAAAEIMNAVVLTAVLSCLNSGIYTASRVLFALSRRGDAPQSVLDVNPRGVPVKAIVACTAVAYVGIALAYISPDTVFLWLLPPAPSCCSSTSSSAPHSCACAESSSASIPRGSGSGCGCIRG